MDKIKLIQKHQKKIIEGIFVCLIGGWALSSILRGAFQQITNLDYCSGQNFPVVIFMLAACSIALAVIFYTHDNIARILMFAFVYLFIILCAYNGYDVQWGTVSYNAIGNVCFGGMLSFLAVLAFLYVKEDIFQLFNQIKINQRTGNIIIGVIGVLIFAFVGITTVLRYVTYSNSTFDFGIFAQMYEYMKQKGTIDTTVERNYLLSHFGVHFSPIYYLGLPIYFIFSSPVTVQLIQAFMIALPVVPIILLCRHYKMSPWMTIAVSLLYALYPATAGGAMYDMHENCFLTFMILMTVWAVEKKKNLFMVVFMLLTFWIKEDAAIYILVLGAYFLFSRKDKKRGIILMILAVVYFGIAISVVSSFGLGIMDNRFANLYFNPDGGMGQIIQTIIINPVYVIGQMIKNSEPDNMEKIEYMMEMLIPVAAALFTTGKKYSRYILLAPFVMINLVPTYLYMHNITFQYNFGVIALFMYMIIMNISDMKIDKAKTVACVSVICAGVLFAGLMFPKLMYYSDKYSDTKDTLKQMDTALEIIPENASVSASGFLVPHLSKNLELYDQNHLETDKYTDYLVVDERYSSEKEKFNNILASGQYESVYSVPGVIQIYHKK